MDFPIPTGFELAGGTAFTSPDNGASGNGLEGHLNGPIDDIQLRSWGIQLVDGRMPGFAAIVGAAKQMHTVITAACTGCDLCLPPCPVDCIDMVELGALAARGNRHAAELARQSIRDMADIARSRYRFHQFRIAREKTEREDRLAIKADAKLAQLESLPDSHDLERKKAAVRAAIERARARRAGIQDDASKTKT